MPEGHSNEQRRSEKRDESGGAASIYPEFDYRAIGMPVEPHETSGWVRRLAKDLAADGPPELGIAFWEDDGGAPLTNRTFRLDHHGVSDA